MPDESAGPEFESGQDILRAVARGPESVFLHWELEGALSAEIPESEPCQWVVRAVNLSDGSSHTMPVERSDGRCYAVVEPGCTYGFELAVRTAGRWRTICRSERVHVPAARPRTRQADAPSGASAPSGRGLKGATAARAPHVPGLRAETTPLRLGSSPHSPPDAAAEG